MTRLPLSLILKLHSALIDGVAARRGADFVIGVERTYLRRWWIIPRNRFANAYLHEICADDDDRALHDHPWVNCSILLSGRYVEHTIEAGGVEKRVERRAGDIVFRGPRAAHRLELVDGTCWTLFLTGPRLREWGFHCPKGWVPWQQFTTADGRGVGRGCGEVDR